MTLEQGGSQRYRDLIAWIDSWDDDRDDGDDGDDGDDTPAEIPDEPLSPEEGELIDLLLNTNQSADERTILQWIVSTFPDDE